MLKVTCANGSYGHLGADAGAGVAVAVPGKRDVAVLLPCCGAVGVLPLQVGWLYGHVCMYGLKSSVDFAAQSCEGRFVEITVSGVTVIRKVGGVWSWFNKIFTACDLLSRGLRVM